MVCRVLVHPLSSIVFFDVYDPCVVSRDQAFSRQKCNRDEPISGQWRSKYIFSSSSPHPPHCLLMKLLCSKFSRHARSEWRNACLCNSLPGYYEASRTKPLPSLLLFLGSPPTITHRNKKKELDHERDGWKTSVTFITFHVLHYAVNAEQWVQKDVSGREMGLSRHFVTSQAVWE